MSNPQIVKAYKAQEDLPEVLGSLGLDFTDQGIEIVFDQIIEQSKAVEPVKPKELLISSRDLQGDPNDQKIIKDIEETKDTE
jgi:hypothetical protein